LQNYKNFICDLSWFSVIFIYKGKWGKPVRGGEVGKFNLDCSGNAAERSEAALERKASVLFIRVLLFRFKKNKY